MHNTNRPSTPTRIQTRGLVLRATGATAPGEAPGMAGDIAGGVVGGAAGCAAAAPPLEAPTGVPQFSQNAPRTWAPHDVQNAIWGTSNPSPNLRSGAD